MKRIVHALAALAIAMPLSATAATTTAACSSLGASESYLTFGGCIAEGNNTFSNVNAIVMSLFGDEGIAIDPALSFYQGTPTPTKAGAEFTGDRISAGFDATDGFVGMTALNFFSLPEDTLFVALKASTGFTLYSAANFEDTTFQSAMTNKKGKPQAISNIGTYSGTTPEVSPVPVPAAGVLLVGAIGGLGLMRRRKKAV